MKKYTSRARQTEPVPFELDGQTFTCLPEVPGTLLLEWAAAMGADGSVSSAIILRFLKRAMTVEEHARFRSYVDAAETVVDVQTLGEIVSDLVSEYADRPTPPSTP